MNLGSSQIHPSQPPVPFLKDPFEYHLPVCAWD